MGKMPGVVVMVSESEANELIAYPTHVRPAVLSWIRNEAEMHQAGDPAIRELIKQVYIRAHTRGREGN